MIDGSISLEKGLNLLMRTISRGLLSSCNTKITMVLIVDVPYQKS